MKTFSEFLLELAEHIVKKGNQYQLRSKKRGKDGKTKNLGTFKSKAQALKRERQVNYFKSHK